MEITKFAPVIIPTLNRYDHFKRCLESLEQCTWADKTDVYVALDYPLSEKYVEGWKKIDEYLHSKEKNHSFNSLNIIRRNTNYFMQGKVFEGIIEMATSNIDCYITSEDDNEFAPSFLDFMNKAFEKYRNEPKVNSISGYSLEGYSQHVDSNVCFMPGTNAWGYGRWINKNRKADFNNIKKTLLSPSKIYKLYRISPIMILGLSSMYIKNQLYGDYYQSISNVLEDKFQLRPRYNLVRNHGYDGSGVHCGKDSSMKDEKIYQEKEYFIDDNVSVKMSKDLSVYVRKDMFPHTFWGDLRIWFSIWYYLGLSYLLLFKRHYCPINFKRSRY